MHVVWQSVTIQDVTPAVVDSTMALHDDCTLAREYRTTIVEEDRVRQLVQIGRWVQVLQRVARVQVHALLHIVTVR